MVEPFHLRVERREDTVWRLGRDSALALIVFGLGVAGRVAVHA